MIDLRLQFGWRNSPVFWGLRSSALEHAHTHTTFGNAVVSGEGRAAVDHVRVQGDPLADVVPLPSDCLLIPGGKGMAGDPFFVRYYVDDGILAEVQFFPEGRRCMRAIQLLASDKFRLLGSCLTNEPHILEARKMIRWSTQLEVLGWIIDTDRLTVAMPPHKRHNLRNV